MQGASAHTVLNLFRFFIFFKKVLKNWKISNFVKIQQINLIFSVKLSHNKMLFKNPIFPKIMQFGQKMSILEKLKNTGI